jgi:hypothetical protein
MRQRWTDPAAVEAEIARIRSEVDSEREARRSSKQALFGAGGASGAGALENPKYPLTAGGMGAATGGGGGGLACSAFCKLAAN